VELYLHADYGNAASREDLFKLPQILEGLAGRSSRSAGKITLWQWRPQWLDGCTAIVREFVHGGFLGGMAGSLFAGRARMVRELRVCLHARSNDVPTCEPVALRIQRVIGPLVRAHLVTKKIEGSSDLLEVCRELSAGLQPSSAQRRLLVERMARAIAAMHDAGIVHADLNLKNLLVKDPLGDPQVFIVDFDKARVLEHVSLRRRLKNLIRLDRSIVKWPEARQQVSISDRLRLWRDYLQLYPAWAGRWKGLARRYRTRHLAHVLSRKARIALAAPPSP